MFALVFRFPAGRYHATPWGRNVNEADIAWPPEPWRILRALIATWWRKGNRGRWSEEDLAALIDALAVQPPIYKLPDGAVHTHTRHYMPAPVKTTLVFDAFARLPADSEMIAAWPEATLPKPIFTLAADLASGVGYLGRAESWTECTALTEWDVGVANCLPEEADKAKGEPVRLIALRTPSDYAAERARLLATFEESQRQSAIAEGKKVPTPKALESARKKAFGRTLPERLVDALTLDTSDYQGFGWSRPPASRELIYLRQPLTPTARLPRRRASITDEPTRFTVARFVLAGRPRPRIEDTVKIAEIMRLAAMAKFGWQVVDDKRRPNAPAAISGYGADGKPLRDDNHAHAFWLPEDSDGDGEIDHVIVYAAAGLDNECRQKLDQITRLWLNKRGRDDNEEESTDRGRKEWRLALDGFGRPDDFAVASSLLGCSTRWLSVTPYLMPWHAKKGFGWADQIARELAKRNMPKPCEPPTDQGLLIIKGRHRRPIHFHRFRSRRGLRQPDMLGRFIELRFKEPIPGPLALGFGCHFGLGMFRAVP